MQTHFFGISDVHYHNKMQTFMPASDTRTFHITPIIIIIIRGEGSRGGGVRLPLKAYGVKGCGKEGVPRKVVRGRVK